MIPFQPTFTNSQVFKCAINGRIAYSDTPCPTSATKEEVIRATPNTLDMREAREQEYRARERQEISEQERMYQNMFIQQQQSAHQRAQAQAQARQRAQEEYQKEWQKFEDKFNLGKKKRRALSPSPPPPAQIVNCDPAGCWDTNGNRLNRAAGGNFFRSDGRFCVNTGGGGFSCN